jgi:hypothetical protein
MTRDANSAGHPPDHQRCHILKFASPQLEGSGSTWAEPLRWRVPVLGVM